MHLKVDPALAKMRKYNLFYTRIFRPNPRHYLASLFFREYVSHTIQDSRAILIFSAILATTGIVTELPICL